MTECAYSPCHPVQRAFADTMALLQASRPGTHACGEIIIQGTSVPTHPEHCTSVHGHEGIRHGTIHHKDCVNALLKLLISLSQLLILPWLQVARAPFTELLDSCFHSLVKADAVPVIVLPHSCAVNRAAILHPHTRLTALKTFSCCHVSSIDLFATFMIS
jgi:hypothetical protein